MAVAEEDTKNSFQEPIVNPDHPIFTRAIARTPAPNFAEGLTTQDLGTPDYSITLEQHATYCAALSRCGLELIMLEPDPYYPDSTFVEDTAILVPSCAVLTRPGAAERMGEVAAIRDVLVEYFSRFYAIQPPGHLDGGDICEAGKHFFIGVSERTNVAGAVQLAEILANQGYTSDLVDIRTVPGILHLKSGLSYLGDNKLAIIEALASNSVFRDYEQILVKPEEEYAANCVRINDYVLMADGFPGFERSLRDAGLEPLVINVSEFRKMDGGLSCLSLRF